MSEQLPLNLAPEPKYIFENFVVGKSNRDAYTAVSAYPNWPAPVLILYGPTGCGKTHLGQAWLNLFKNVVFIDNASSSDELDLFSAINKALNGECAGTLLSDSRHPENWNVSLPDLRSRLDYIPKFSIERPSDDVLGAVIRKLFEDKGRSIKADIVAYILTHYDRSVPLISKLVQDIETQASAQKRDVTRNFVATILKRAGDA